MIKVGIGQDSHRFEVPMQAKPLLLGGVDFQTTYAFEGNSDSDVILHAITNAISGITAKPILGPRADSLCKEGVTNSNAYLKLALTDLALMGNQINHVSVSVECQKPKILPRIPELRMSLSKLLSIAISDIGITATSGEGLTDFGKGLGVQVIAVVTSSSKNIK